jgi:hypothetical protein
MSLIRFTVFAFCLTAWSPDACGQYQQRKPVPTTESVVAVEAPGSYASPGTTYILTRDISSDRSTIFLGKDVTLDLNGYTLRYADGKYEHITNSGFEEGERGWDLSKAPGAEVVNTADVHVFVGKKLLRLKPGDEIRSSYVYLPVSNRSYFAMCGITGFDFSEMSGDLKNQMKVSVYVEDERGNNVVCSTDYGDGKRTSCPVEGRSPRLGGGFVYAHLNNLPAGKYRVRIKADTDCLVDEIDIRPAGDVGIGIVENTFPGGHYDHLYESQSSAFFDYTASVTDSLPVASIPLVEGGGTVTIRNGTIENAALGVLSFGIQSTAQNVKVILDNVRIKTAGINTIAVDVPQATITNCRFEVESPFIINRHGSSFYAVDLRGPHPSEVSFSEFYGGQGCLVFKGKGSSVHHNYFANRQMVTNHYSIMAMGDGSQIFQNTIIPEVGSGIEIYKHKDIDIFNNTIKIKTSPPTCEYGHEEYSTAAVRLADYRAKAGAADACSGNRVYGNQIVITAEEYPQHERYTPMSWAIYYSASGGDNFIFGNDITVERANLKSNVLAAAFYICGGPEGYGGQFYNNTVRTNVPAAWIASMYGGAANTKIFHNRIIKASTGDSDLKVFRMGSSGCNSCVAKGIEFRSNTIMGGDFDISITDQGHDYSVFWSLTVELKDKKGRPVKQALIEVIDSRNQRVFSGLTDVDGIISTDLKAMVFNNGSTFQLTPFTIVAGKIKKEVSLTRDTHVELVVKSRLF